MRPRAAIAFGVCAGLTLLAAFIAIRIEIFNIRAGGLLPRNPADGKWQAEYIFGLIADYYQKARSEGRPELSAAEKEELNLIVAEAREDSRFRGFVGSWGLAQHVIAPAGLITSLLLVQLTRPRAGRILAAGLALTCLACIALMFYRGYFSSLGW